MESLETVAPHLLPRSVSAGIGLNNALHAGVGTIAHRAKIRDVGLVHEAVGVMLDSVHDAFGLVLNLQNGALERRTPRLHHALQGRRVNLRKKFWS